MRKRTSASVPAGINPLLLILLTSLLIHLFCFMETYSQQQYYFKPASVSDKLSQNTINCLLQDKKGMVWVGTQDGLNRFDGYSFEIFRTGSASDRKAISGTDVTDLLSDTDGKVWVSTRSGLSVYSYQTGRFINLQIVNRKNGSIEELTAITEAGGSIITASRSGVIYRVDKSGMQYSELLSENDKHVLCLETLSSGSVLAGLDGGGIWQLSPGEKIFSRLVMHGISYGSSVRFIREDSAKNVWIGSSEGLKVYRPDFNLSRIISFPGGKITAGAEGILFRKNSECWIGTSNGLYIVNGRNAEKINFNTGLPGVSQDESIQALLEDDNGLVWIGTYKNGLFQLYQKFGLIPKGTAPGKSLKADIMSISADNRGNIWLGSWGSGISFYDSKSHKISYLPSDNTFLPCKNIFGLYTDKNSSVWLGMWSASAPGSGIPSYGLSVYHPETKSIRHFKDSPGTPFYKDIGIGVISIHSDREGNIWCGTLGHGIYIYNRASDSFRNLDELTDHAGFLKKSPIHSIFRDSKNRMWIATRSEGAAFIDNNKITRLFNNQNDPNSMPTNEILAISEDSAGDIWIATGTGPVRYLAKEEKILRFSEEHGYPGGVSYSVLPGDYPFVWISSNNGIIRLNSLTQEFHTLNLPEIVSKEFMQGAFGKGIDGTLYFGNMNGLLFFRPDEVETNSIPPKVVLRSVNKFYQPVIFDSDAAEKSAFEFYFNENILTFQFAALDYSNPEMNTFEFYLEGFDHEWNKVGRQNFITYTNLSPGEYQLMVRAANSAGVWSASPLKLSIVIIPPFYQRTWFKITVILTVIVILVGGYQLRIRHLRRIQKEELEKQRITDEINTARLMQANLLPKTLPESTYFSLGALCKLAYETGGDFYDAFWINSEKTKLCIISADVSGKAMKASVGSILLTGILSNMRDTGFADTGDAMRRISNSLFQKKPEKRMYAALSLAVFDFSALTFHLCNAGQPEPLLLRENRISYISTEDPRTPAGVFRDVEYKEVVSPVKKGDIYVFYSDAIPESQNKQGEQYGYRRFEYVIQNSGNSDFDKIAGSIASDLDAFTAGMQQYDDTTILVLKIND